MRRCSEKARSFSSYSFFSAQDLLQNPQLLEYAAMLHSFNTNKYNHPINFYNLESLKTILASPLNPYFYICIRFGKNDVPLQVGIFLIDKNRSHLYFLAQGINHIAHTSDVNLYIALFFEAFSFAEYLSLEEVHLGRANHLTKKRLGANAFYLLSNWMKPLNNLYSPLITSLSQKGSSFLNIKDYQFT